MSEHIGESGSELPARGKRCSCGHAFYEINGTAIVLCMVCDFTNAGRSGPPVPRSQLGLIL
jgi:hypothetical protein